MNKKKQIQKKNTYVRQLHSHQNLKALLWNPIQLETSIHINNNNR